MTARCLTGLDSFRSGSDKNSDSSDSGDASDSTDP
jgi:hypothetical protein